MQMHASLQRKFSFSYIAIILAVLILLNTYPLITSENLTFRSKQSSLQGSVSVMVTALSGLEELSEENVAGAMTLVEETGISRVLVTDASGRVLYDTRETDGAIGRYAFYTELVQALRGEDVFYTEFSDKAFKSRAASPVIYHSQTIGAVYAYEYDTEQAELLLSLPSPCPSSLRRKRNDQSKTPGSFRSGGSFPSPEIEAPPDGRLSPLRHFFLVPSIRARSTASPLEAAYSCIHRPAPETGT